MGKEFPLLPNNALTTMLTRFLPMEAVIGVLLALAFFLAGVFSEVIAVTVGVTVVLFSAALLWAMRRSQEGVAELRPECLLVRTAYLQQSYPWGHIESIEIITIRETGALRPRLYSLFGVNVNQTLVRLRLRRWLRTGLLGKRGGTDIFGLPNPGFKVVELFLEDPEGLVSEAVPHLQAAGSSRA